MTPWLDDGDVRLYHGDALEVLGELDSVDAIVTSPPYADQRPYAGGSPPDLYADWLEPFLAAMLRVVSPSGSLLLNIGRVHRDGEEQPCAMAALDRARAVGWRWIDTLIWQKPNGFIAASTRTPHSETTLARFSHGFRKSTSKADTRYHTAGKRIAPPHPDGARPKSVATFAVSTHRGINHPAPMPVELARHLVSLACPRRGIVLDPFCGSGTTLLAARERGRRGVGVDVNEEYLEESARRLSQLSLLGGAASKPPSGGRASSNASSASSKETRPRMPSLQGVRPARRVNCGPGRWERPGPNGPLETQTNERTALRECTALTGWAP